MTPERAKELLPVIQAFSEGRTVQVQTPQGEWFNMKDPEFTWNNGKYRIKPEVVRYRRYVMKLGDNYIITIFNSVATLSAEGIEAYPAFVRWIDTDWVEVSEDDPNS